MTDSNEWTYMFSMVKGTKEAAIYISNGLDEKFRVVGMHEHDPREIVEDDDLNYCREYAENFVMERMR